MATAHLQPISGVSTGSETEIMSVFPSIGSTPLGRLLGRLFESIPLGRCPVKLSHLLFTLPLSPLALFLYFWLKISGVRYTLTNRALVVKNALGNRELERVELAGIGDVLLEEQPGHYFYRCKDMILLGKNGDPLLILPGVPRAEVFRQIVLEARDAALQVQESLAVIEARHSS